MSLLMNVLHFFKIVFCGSSINKVSHCVFIVFFVFVLKLGLLSVYVILLIK